MTATKEFNAVCGQLVLTKLDSRQGYILTSDAGGNAVIIDQWVDLVELSRQILSEDFRRQKGQPKRKDAK